MLSLLPSASICITGNEELADLELFLLMIKKLFERTVQYITVFNITYNFKPTVIKQHFDFSSKAPKVFITRPSYKESLMDSNTTMIDIDLNLRLKAHRICSDHLGGAWSKISPSDMSLIPISGGMSNSIFCCSLPEYIMLSNAEPTQVLLRFYGDQSRNCDMSIQLEIFNLLSLKDLGPKLFGTFEDGRLEEFLPATSLTCDELMNHEISSIIARKLALVHSLDVPIDKSNTWLKERYYEWLEFINEQEKPPKFSEGTRQSTIDIANQLLTIDFEQETKFLLDVIEKTQSPTVFSHNDLHQGNILLAKYSKRRLTSEERVVFIDFEYCSYNYRAYDIANHFCEWCFEYDTPDYPHFMFFADRFPSVGIQRDFVRDYSIQSKQSSDSSKSFQNGAIVENNKAHCDSGSTNDSKLNGHSKNKNKNQETENLLREIQPFFMAANLLWTLWCVKSAYSSTIRFGYWEHAFARWNLYSSFKESYLKKREPHRNGGSVAE